MGRLERRYLEKTKKHYANLDKVREEAVTDAFALMMSVSLDVLHDRFGFGVQRLGSFCEDVVDRFSMVDLGVVDWDAYSEKVWKQCGVRIEKR